MAGPAASIELTATEARQLTTLVQAGTTPQRLVRRARVILVSAAGSGSRALARQEQMSHGPGGRIGGAARGGHPTSRTYRAAGLRPSWDSAARC
jgi:hypothetical protein